MTTGGIWHNQLLCVQSLTSLFMLSHASGWFIWMFFCSTLHKLMVFKQYVLLMWISTAIKLWTGLLGCFFKSDLWSYWLKSEFSSVQSPSHPLCPVQLWFPSQTTLIHSSIHPVDDPQRCVFDFCTAQLEPVPAPWKKNIFKSSLWKADVSCYRLNSAFSDVTIDKRGRGRRTLQKLKYNQVFMFQYEPDSPEKTGKCLIWRYTEIKVTPQWLKREKKP